MTINYFLEIFDVVHIVYIVNITELVYVDVIVDTVEPWLDDVTSSLGGIKNSTLLPFVANNFCKHCKYHIFNNSKTAHCKPYPWLMKLR